MCSGDPLLRWRHPLAGGGMSPQTHRLSLFGIVMLLFALCCRIKEKLIHLLLIDV